MDYKYFTAVGLILISVLMIAEVTSSRLLAKEVGRGNQNPNCLDKDQDCGIEEDSDIGAPSIHPRYNYNANSPQTEKPSMLKKANGQFRETSPEEAYSAFARMRNRKGYEERSTILAKPTLASNIGVRYGLPVINDTILLPKTRIVNVVAQIKSGAFDGLAVFTDTVPHVSERYSGQNYSLGWQRVTVGWALSMDFSGWLRRLELTPRMGYWETDATLPHQEADSSLGHTDFKFQSLSLGFEFSLGFDFLYSTSFRLWSARDIAQKFGQQTAESAGTLSQRFGLDYYFPGWDLRLGSLPVRIVPLTYLMLDRFNLKSRTTGVFDSLFGEAEKADIQSIYYDLIYSGLGVTVTF